MTKFTTRYLTIHFAPMTACVVLEISEDKFNALADAMGGHTGLVKLKISTYHEIATKIST